MKWDAEKYDSAKSPQVDAGRELVALAKVSAKDSVLDIGCGTGRLTVELARLASKGKVLGIDPSVEMLEKAERTSLGSGNLRFSLSSAQSMAFTDQFDLIFSNSALQWIKEQDVVLGLIYRALKSGGRVAFQFPPKNFCAEFFDYAERAVSLLGYEDYFRNWQPPWYLPLKEEYEGLLKAVGFTDINVYYKDYRLVFDCIGEVLGWWTSAGLRPYLEVLPPREQEYFKYAVAMCYENNRTSRGIEFDFRRLFAFAAR